jgi:hypothetical protein
MSDLREQIAEWFRDMFTMSPEDAEENAGYLLAGPLAPLLAAQAAELREVIARVLCVHYGDVLDEALPVADAILAVLRADHGITS